MAIKNKIGIDTFDKSINVDQSLNIPLPKDLLKDEDLALVKEAFTVVSKYRTSSWMVDISLSEMQSDLIYLQSTLVSIAYSMGLLANFSTNAEERLKIARAKVRVNGKALRQTHEDVGDSVTVTLDDIKELSYTKTEDLWTKAENCRIASEFIKFIYFAIRDHVSMLDKTIHRIHRTE